MYKLSVYIIWLVIFFSQTVWATSATVAKAKITHVHISHPPGLTRFTLQIANGAFYYRWQLSADKKTLNINIDNVILATTLPKLALSATPVKDYCVKPQSNKATLLLQFQLKTVVNPKIYTLAASATQGARLLVDFQSTAHKIAVDVPDALAAVSANEKHPSPDEMQQPLPTTNPTEPKLTLLDNAPNRPIMIVIDPGHGGKDSGAVGPDSTREKDVVLAISRLLQQSFAKQPEFQAQLTRNRDVFIPLRERLAIARRCKADIFIAIHADAAYKNQDAIGASVFALSERGATSEMARWLAKKENESELIYGVVVDKDPVLRSVLLDLSQTHTIAVSLEMGQEILSKLGNITKLHYKRVEQAAFVVLKSPDIPSLLVETGYISNPIQEQKLKNPVYQQQLANTIVRGVMAYFAQHPPGKRLITT